MNKIFFNKISVIVPAKNERVHIEKCLIALINQDYDNESYEIIVIDNGSSDDTVDIVKKFDNVRLILCPSGPVGRVRNKGAECAKGSILAFIDADCIAPADWLKAINLWVKDGHVVGGGAKLPSPSNNIEKFWLLEGPDGHSLPKELIGASIAITKNDFEAVQGFNESLPSGEDSDISMRIKRLNISVKISREFSVVHLGNAKTTGAFIKRQMWHGENYSFSLNRRIKEPIFILTTLWTVSFYQLIFALFLESNVTFPLALIVLIPALLCAKRIFRSGCGARKLLGLPYIYYLDLLYVVGRSLGMQKAIIVRALKY